MAEHDLRSPALPQAVSDCRAQILGAAALWIAFYHSHIRFAALSASPVWTAVAVFLDTVRTSGNAGVDVFLLLSGFGLYYSFARDGSLKRFYRKRALRVLPPFLIVSAIWTAMEGYGGMLYVRRVLLLDFFTDGNTTCWYVNLLVILYILYPLVHKCIAKRPIVSAVAWSAGSVALTLALYRFAPELYKNIHLALPRVPVFVLGVVLGKCAYENKRFPRAVTWAAAAFAALTFALLLFLNATGRAFPRDIVKLYLYCPFALSLVLTRTAIASRRGKGTKGFLSRVGAYSFEIYLLYEKVAASCTRIFTTDDRMHLLYYVPVFLLTALLAVALHAFCARIVRVGSTDGGDICR
jgi:peptidoglycan/LPS O-acetylase OafA/YrhL